MIDPGRVPGPELVPTHLFFGSSPNFALIVGGIHASEQSGVEVVHWVRVKLASRPTPTLLGAMVIPEVYPDRGFDARTAENQMGAEKWNKGANDDYRYKDAKTKISVARQFPPPGYPLAVLQHDLLRDRDGRTLLRLDSPKKMSQVPLFPESRYLINCIELLQPVRIVSVHGKIWQTKDKLRTLKCNDMSTLSTQQIQDWDGTTALKGANFPGVFVDPRYSIDDRLCPGSVEECKFDMRIDPAFPCVSGNKVVDSAWLPSGQEDDKLALEVAQAVEAISQGLVPGNHLSDPPEVVHYAKEPAQRGFSLGDWGPATVGDPTRHEPGSRSGAPVLTFEVRDDNESWAFLDGVQVKDEDGMDLDSPRRTKEVTDQWRKAHRARRLPKFDQGRSKQLQAYADAIIKTILELPRK